MPERISLKNHLNVLNILARAKKADYKIILDNTPELPKVIRKLCRYVLNGNIKLETRQKNKLKKHKRLIRKISNSGHNTIKTAMQKGGSIIQTLIRTVLPLIPALLL